MINTYEGMNLGQLTNLAADTLQAKH